MSIRTKFIGVFLLFSVGTLLLFSGLAFYFVSQAFQKSVETNQLQFVELQKKAITRFFQEEIFDKNLNIVVPKPQTAVPLDCDLRPLFEQTFELNPAIQEVTMIAAATGRGISEPGRCAESGESIPVAFGVELYHQVRNGELEVDAQRNYKNDEKFQQALSGEKYISEVQHTLAGPMVTVAAAAYNQAPAAEEPSVLFVTVANVSLSSLLEQVASQQTLGQSDYLVVFDGQHNFLSGSYRVVVGKDMLTLPAWIQGLDAAATSDAYRGMLGKEVVGAYTRLPEVGGWVVLSEWPTQEAYAVLTRLRLQIILFTLAIFVALSLTSVVVSRVIVRPILLLAKGAEEIGKGKFDQKIAITTGDELEHLGQRFNEMAKGLKRLDELRKEFVFIATHELRAPITAIKGYLDLIREAGVELPKTIEMPVARITQVNDNLVHLVDDLLEIARAEAGRLQVEVSPQELAPIVDEIVASLGVVAEPRKVVVRIDALAAVLPRVMADPDKLREVLMNLVSNAIKYNRDGGSVTVSHEIIGDKVITRVADTGIGMSVEEQTHLFEKFWRSNDVDVRKQTGTGLGLFIVKEIIERMDGKIWAQSEKGTGTTFSFSLFIAKENA